MASIFPPQRLLIVDDDPNSICMLSGILEETAKIFFANSGEEALCRIRQHSPDLVLLDAEMPGIGGFKTCTTIKENPDTEDLPVVFVTAHVDTDFETHALASGAADFIHKPVNPPVLLARVKTQLALKRKSDELHRLSSVDTLTNVANRRIFNETLRAEWRRAIRRNSPLSLLMIDVDFFKKYNDTYGHPAGDRCLQNIASVLAATARSGSDLVARYGGEEFAMILPDTKAPDGHQMAERLCAKVSGLAIPHSASTVAPHVTISAGLGCMFLPSEANSRLYSGCHDCARIEHCISPPESLVALADQALYEAKRSGRGRTAELGSSFALAENANRPSEQ